MIKRGSSAAADTAIETDSITVLRWQQARRLGCEDPKATHAGPRSDGSSERDSGAPSKPLRATWTAGIPTFVGPTTSGPQESPTKRASCADTSSKRRISA